MLRGIDQLTAESERHFGCRISAVGEPDAKAAEIRPGDEIRILYEGEPRTLCIVGVRPWGLVAYDRDREACRSFRFDKIAFPAAKPAR